MPIYMNIDGIPGDVSEHKHEKWIELSSFQLGMNRSIHAAIGRGSNRESGQPNVSEIVVTKPLDDSAAELFRWALGGAGGKTVKIDFVASGGKAPYVYSHYELSDVLLSGFTTSSGGDKPTESLSLNFAKITWKYIQTKADGAPTGKQPVASYDLLTAKGS